MSAPVWSSLHAFAFHEEPARRLATALGADFRGIEQRRFPDGESLVRTAPEAGAAVLYCSLDHPNDRLVDLLLASSALRDSGVRSIVLVAPYLCYMRQDVAFQPGEAVSQKVVARLLRCIRPAGDRRPASASDARPEQRFQHSCYAVERRAASRSRDHRQQCREGRCPRRA